MDEVECNEIDAAGILKTGKLCVYKVLSRPTRQNHLVMGGQFILKREVNTHSTSPRHNKLLTIL